MTRRDSLPARKPRGPNKEPSVARKFTPEVQEIFIRVFTECNSVSQAAKAVGVTTMTVYRAKKEDPNFADLFQKANEVILDNLEKEAYRRAVTGVKKPVYYQGRLVGYELTYSDRLLEMLLRGRSDKYHNKSEVAVGGKVEVEVTAITAKQKLLERVLERGITIDQLADIATGSDEEEQTQEVNNDDQGEDQ
jgi:hypothetical protein